MASFTKTSFIVVLSALCFGCMSNNVKWRYANLPDNKDEWVRFKTTYYFRVVDTCFPPQPKVLSTNTVNDGYYIVSDTLYRFNLTGKAHPWSATKFEAGTLKASQIDPFGKTVSVENGQFKLSSSGADASEATKNEQEKKLNKINDEIKKLIKDKNDAGNDLKKEYDEQIEMLTRSRRQIYRFLYGEHQKTGKNKYSIKVTKDALQGLQSLGAGNFKKYFNTDEIEEGQKIYFSQSTKDVIDDLVGKNTPIEVVYKREDCPPGFTRNHGFLILGPEGWKHFDPEERLMLAMYTSEKPLIETMTELSNRMTNAHSQRQLSDKPFNEEVKRIIEAELNFHREKGLEGLDDRLEKLIEAVDKKEDGGN